MPTLVSVLQKRAKQKPNHTAYLFLGDGLQETGRLSYSQLDKKARAIAAYLQTKCNAGDRVLLIFPTGLHFITAFFGCLYAGVIAVPIYCNDVEDFEKKKNYFKVIDNQISTSYVLTDNTLLPLLNQHSEEIFSQKNILIIDSSRFEECAILYKPVSIQDSTIAYLQYTSGSTTDPKAAVISHKSLSYNVKNSGLVWHFSRKSISLTWAPHSHVYGLVCGLLVPFFYRSLAILIPPHVFLRKPFIWLRAITKYRVTHSGCPNFGYDLCIKHIEMNDFSRLHLKSWKVAVNGGEHICSDTLLRFANKFKAVGFKLNSFCCAYGMSEVAGTISASHYRKKYTQLTISSERLAQNQVALSFDKKTGIKLTSVGSILPGLQVKIMDVDSGQLLSEGKVGEIVVAGKSLLNGYWQKNDEIDASFLVRFTGYAKSYFRTGDLGFIKKNELYITGRLKEVIIRYGKNYYPHDIEHCVIEPLDKYPVGDRAVFSVPILGREEIIFLQEIIDEINESDSNRIIYSIRLAVLKYHGLELRHVILLRANSLPKTTSGKISRKICAQLYLSNKLELLDNHLQQSENIFIDDDLSILKTSVPQILLDEFRVFLATTLDLSLQDIHLDAPLSHFKIDSLKIVQFVAAFNNLYGVEIKPSSIYEYYTFGEFFADVYCTNFTIFTPQTTHLPLELDKTISTPEIKTSLPLDTFAESDLRDDDIAIIGMHGIFPGANDLESFWDNLVRGNDAITAIPSDRIELLSSQNKIQCGGFLENIGSFDADFFNISAHEAALMDPQQRLFLQTVWQTIEDAGYAVTALAQKKIGLYVGVFGNDYAEILQKNVIIDPYLTTGITHSILANRVSYLLNFQGPSEAIDTACSSSLVALAHGIKALQNNECEMAIVGGVNLLLSPRSYLAADEAGMLSPDGQCKTFDKNANGYVRSEGVAAVLLKPLSRAKEDQDHVYAVIRGCAVNHGGHVSSLTVPNPNAQAEVIVAACQHADIAVDTISYVEVHGTGTALGDPIEITGLKKAFATGEKHIRPHCGIGALKTHIGHLEAAAGIAGIIKAALCLHHKILPANLHFKELNPYIDLHQSPFYLINNNQAWQRLETQDGKQIPRRAGVSSFGFGGTNAHVIIEESPNSELQTVDLNYPYHLLTLSAKTKQALSLKINDLYSWLSTQKCLPTIEHLSFTLNKGRDHFEYRFVVIASSISELQESLAEFIEKNMSANILSNPDPKKPQAILQEVCQQHIKELVNNVLTREEFRRKLAVLAAFYIEGYPLPWDELYPVTIKKISLPTYPFAKNYHWLPESNSKSTEAGTLERTETIKENVRHFILTLLKIEKEADVDTNFQELGLDSLGFKVLTKKLQDQYHIGLTPAIFFTYNTIEELSQHICEQISQNKPNVIVSSQKDIKPQNNISEIAIIGVQGYLPQSKNVTQFWQHLMAGEDLITEIPSERWHWQDYYGNSKEDSAKTNSKWGGFIPDVTLFDAGFFNISAREANLMDPQQRLFLEVVWQTIEDAGYNPFTLKGKSVGLFVGMEFNDYQTLIHLEKKIYHGHVSTGNSHSLLANRVSYFFNFHGPSEVINTACSSSLVAIHRAATAIKNGECQMAIAGGVSLMLSPDTFIITSQLGALSPEGRCKSFDESANGYVKGEGVAAILLKSLDDAIAAGDHIYGVIKASGVSHAGKAQSLTAPNANSQSELLVDVYSRANIDPTTINYIETHGTGTQLGDPIEIEGLKLAFKELLQANNKTLPPAPFCGLGSVKTNCGHLEPASGMASLIKVLFAIKTGYIPKNLHFNHLNSYIHLKESPFYVLDQTTSWQHSTDNQGKNLPRRAGISSFGFGGTNAHMIIEEKITTANDIDDNECYLVTLSAKQPASLQQKIQDLQQWLLEQSEQISLTALTFTLNAGRAHFEYRAAMIINNIEHLNVTLNKIIRHEVTDNYYYNSEPVTQTKLFNDDAVLSTKGSYSQCQALAQAYISGADIPWEKLYQRPHRLVGLPPYPFIRKHYWFDAELPVNTDVVKVAVSKSNDLMQATKDYLRNIFAQVLKITIETISNDQTYEMFGVDSVLSVEIGTRIEQDLGSLSKTLLYEHNSINNLCQYLLQTKHAALQQLLTGEFVMSTPTQDERIHTEELPQARLNSDDIAIIGMSGQFPMAKDYREFWQNLKTGKDCISEIPKDRWRYEDFPVTKGDENKYYKYGGFLEDIDKFDPLFFNISPREAMLMDPQERLFLQTAWAVIEDAGYTRETLLQTTDNVVGVFAGVTYNFYPLLIAEEWARGNKLPLDIQSFSIANRISYFLNLSGPSFVIDTACSSSLAAIHLACESLQQGNCRVAIAGGVNLSIHPSKYHFLGSYNLLSEKGRCESFANGGDGYVPSEGVGVVLLKPLAAAIADQDLIYGVIKSSSSNHGGKTSGYTVPNPSAHTALVKNALQKANICASTISYIEAHGTGTALGDPIEIRGLQAAFESNTTKKQFCAIGSVKSNIGHLEAAAGVSQLIKVMLQLQHQQLVPSIHATQTNHYIDFDNSPFYVQQQLSNWDSQSPRRAGMSSFGAGGTNVHIIVEEFNNPVPATPLPAPYIFVLSAQNLERLIKYAQKYCDFLQELKTQQNCTTVLGNLCYTMQIGREVMAARLAVVIHTVDDLLKNLESFIAQKEHSYLCNQMTQTPEIKSDHIIARWVAGEKINWYELYLTTKPQRMALPTYPFAKRRCWVTPESKTEAPVIINKEQTTWLIFQDKQLGYHLMQSLCAVQCFVADHFEQYDDNTFYLNPKDQSHFKQLFSILAQSNRQLQGMIYLWQMCDDTQSDCVQINLPNLITAFKQFAWSQRLAFWLVQRTNCFNYLPMQELRTKLLTNDFPAQLDLYTLELGNEKNLHHEANLILQELKLPSTTQSISSNGHDDIQPPANGNGQVTSESDHLVNHEHVLDIVLNNLAKILDLDEAEIEYDVQFMNYGMDSIVGINFVAELNRFFPNSLTPMDLYRYPTVEHLAKFLAKVSKPKNGQQSNTAFELETNLLNDVMQLDESQLAQLLEEELHEIDLLLEVH